MHVSSKTHTLAHKCTYSACAFLKNLTFFNPTVQDPQMLDQLAKNITRCGLSNSTLNYLRVSKFPYPHFFKSLNYLNYR